MANKRYIAEASDLVDGDRFFDSIDKIDAEDRARLWSKRLSEGVAYSVAVIGEERVGHKVFVHGRLDRTEGAY